MSNRLEHVVNYVANAVWAIEPGVLAVITELVAFHMQGGRLTDEEILVRIGGTSAAERAAELEHRNAELAELARGERGSRARGSGAVALLSLYGVIAPRASMVNNVSGPAGTGMDEFTRTLESALADEEISSIVVDVNSPGGSSDMLLETAARLRSAREEKPIYMVANTSAYSAAYYLMSQATEAIVTPSGGVGSIGAYLAHQNLAGKLEQEGRDVTLISAGKFKVEGNPFEPLSDEARASLQSQVDEVYEQFVDNVARGRGVTTKVVRDDFGEGRTVSAKKALAAGMVDRIDTLEGVVRRALRGGGRPRGARAFAGEGVVDVTSFGSNEQYLEGMAEDPPTEASSEPAPTVPSTTHRVDIENLQYIDL